MALSLRWTPKKTRSRQKSFVDCFAWPPATPQSSDSQKVILKAALTLALHMRPGQTLFPGDAPSHLYPSRRACSQQTDYSAARLRLHRVLDLSRAGGNQTFPDRQTADRRQHLPASALARSLLRTIDSFRR